MKRIFIIDCTLRDGGYINKWNFGKNKISFIIDKINQANIDILEIGYYTKTRSTSEDKTLYSDLKKIDCKLKQSNNIVMINYGEVDIDKVPEKKAIKNISSIRLAFHKKDSSCAIEYCKKLMEKGWEVFIQPMVTMSYSDKELIELITKVNELHPKAMYIVDSFGTMQSHDIEVKFGLLSKLLNKDISIGFHSHNNMQLSFSNVMKLLSMNINRDTYIDSSVYGMGRGAGNLNTELITNFLKYNGHNYDNKPLLEIIDECLQEEKKKESWGYCIEYYLSAKYNCHPNYSKYLSTIHTLNIYDIDEILKNICENKKSIYSEDHIKELYMAYLNHNIDDKKSYTELKKILDNKKILLLGSGQSIVKQQDRINRYIDNNTIVISLNNMNDLYDVDILFVSNKRRFHEVNNKRIKQKLFYTSNIIENKKKGTIVFDYLSNLAREYEINDNVLLIFINILKKTGIKEIYLCGFDGFSYGEKNYYSDDLSYTINKETINRINESIKRYIKLYKKDIKINWITSSKYEE